MTPAELDALWNFSDPAASEQRFRAWEETAKAGGDDLYLEWQTQLARTQSLQRKFAEAHEILDRVEPRLGGSARPRLRYMLERGRTFNSAKEAARALPLFTAAWELGRSSGEEALAVDAAHMVAIAEQGEASLAWNQQALAYARTCTDLKARRWVGSLTNNMGWSYHELGRHEDRRWWQALDPLARAFADRFKAYLPRLTYPIRVGAHPNSSFALLHAHRWAARHDADLAYLVATRAADWEAQATEQDRQANARAHADMEFLAREVASLRMALGEVATRDFLRSELRDLLEELEERQRNDEDTDPTSE